MAKTKPPAPRKPIKARGALPVPKQAPERDLTPWYGKTKYRVLIGLLALVVLGVAARMVLDASERREQRRLDIRAIEQFRRTTTELNLDVQPLFEQVSSSPGALLAGELSAEEYLEQAQLWEQSFTDLNNRLRNTDVSRPIERLNDAKALYVQGSTIFVDAAKSFRAAGETSDAQGREDAAVLGRNLLLHGAAVYAMGDREIIRLRNEFGLNDPAAELPAPQQPAIEVELPDETATATVPGADAQAEMAPVEPDPEGDSAGDAAGGDEPAPAGPTP